MSTIDIKTVIADKATQGAVERVAEWCLANNISDEEGTKLMHLMAEVSAAAAAAVLRGLADASARARSAMALDTNGLVS